MTSAKYSSQAKASISLFALNDEKHCVECWNYQWIESWSFCHVAFSLQPWNMWKGFNYERDFLFSSSPVTWLTFLSLGIMRAAMLMEDWASLTIRLVKQQHTLIFSTYHTHFCLYMVPLHIIICFIVFSLLFFHLASYVFHPSSLFRLHTSNIPSISSKLSVIFFH